ncbi:MAG: M20/M25/M40 family metallo-hydrolase [Gemmatimonadaceae bacterium]|nr:M20/M25/M40 family metallo-hydrolase [Gemmatimonadaceae bacterium]
MKHRALPARGDAVALAQALVRIDSVNPTLVPGGAGEMEAAEFLAATLRKWGFLTGITEAAPGRPNVVATGGNGPRSILLNGHLDVVGTEGMWHAPFDGEIKNGRLWGRGSADMKAGIAAMCAAAVRSWDAGDDLRVTIAAVCDEEYESIGTRALLASGIEADAAIVTEPTRLAIAPAHRGFAWIDIEFEGVAAHGSRYDIGMDAITHAGLLLAELDVYNVAVLTHRTHPLLGHASLHASLIRGGTGMSTYPEACVLSVERRTIPRESAGFKWSEWLQFSPASFDDSDPPKPDPLAEINAAIRRLKERVPNLKATATLKTAQLPSDVPVSAPIVRALEAALEDEGEEPRIEGLTAWTDAALFNAAGIPAICFGPGDIALAHAAEEYVPLDEIQTATAVLARLLHRWSGEAVISD